MCFSCSLLSYSLGASTLAGGGGGGGGGRGGGGGGKFCKYAGSVAWLDGTCGSSHGGGGGGGYW